MDQNSLKKGLIMKWKSSKEELPPSGTNLLFNIDKKTNYGYLIGFKRSVMNNIVHVINLAAANDYCAHYCEIEYFWMELPAI